MSIISDANAIQRALNAENSARAEGLSIRFIRSWNPDMDHYPVHVVTSTYAGRLTDDGFYPSRVTSGRERSTE